MRTLHSFYFPNGMDSFRDLRQGLIKLQSLPNYTVYDDVMNYIIQNYSIEDIERYINCGNTQKILVDRLFHHNPQEFFKSRHTSIIDHYTMTGYPGEYEWVLEILNSADKYCYTFAFQALNFYHNKPEIQSKAIEILLHSNDKDIIQFIQQFKKEEDLFVQMLEDFSISNIPHILTTLQNKPELIVQINDEHIQKLADVFTYRTNQVEYNRTSDTLFVLLRTILNQRPELAVNWYDKVDSQNKQYILWVCQHPNFSQWLQLTGAQVSITAKKTLVLKLWAEQLDTLLSITAPIHCNYMNDSEKKVIFPILEKAIQYGNIIDLSRIKHETLNIPLRTTVFRVKDKVLASLGVKRKQFLETLLSDEHTLSLGQGLIQYAELKYQDKKIPFVWENVMHAEPDEIELVV